MPLKELRQNYRFRIEVIGGKAWETLEIPGPGIPVVFLAGSQGTSEVFVDAFLHFAGKRAMLGIHYPDEADPTALAEGLDALLDRLGHPRLALVTSSFGAYWAQFFANRFGERIDWMILGNAFADAEDVKSIPLFDESVLAGMTPQELKAGRVQALRDGPEGRFQDIMLDLMGARQSAENLYARFMGVAQAKPAPVAQMPTDRIVILECDDDPIIAPPMKARLQAAYLNAQQVLIPGGGHFPHVLASDAYLKFLSPWMRT